MPIPGIPVLEGKYFSTMDFYPHGSSGIQPDF